MSQLSWSVVVGGLGVLASGLAVPPLAGRWTNRGAHLYWLVGLCALVPAWLIAFFDMLTTLSAGPIEAVRPGMFMVPSAAGLLGVIGTEMAVRRLERSSRRGRPVTYWLLGVLALVPVWVVTLVVAVSVQR